MCGKLISPTPRNCSLACLKLVVWRNCSLCREQEWLQKAKLWKQKPNLSGLVNTRANTAFSALPPPAPSSRNPYGKKKRLGCDTWLTENAGCQQWRLPEVHTLLPKALLDFTPLAIFHNPGHLLPSQNPRPLSLCIISVRFKNFALFSSCVLDSADAMLRHGGRIYCLFSSPLVQTRSPQRRSVKPPSQW